MTQQRSAIRESTLGPRRAFSAGPASPPPSSGFKMKTTVGRDFGELPWKRLGQALFSCTKAVVAVAPGLEIGGTDGRGRTREEAGLVGTSDSDGARELLASDGCLSFGRRWAGSRLGCSGDPIRTRSVPADTIGTVHAVFPFAQWNVCSAVAAVSRFVGLGCWRSKLDHWVFRSLLSDRLRTALSAARGEGLWRRHRDGRARGSRPCAWAVPRKAGSAERAEREIVRRWGKASPRLWDASARTVPQRGRVTRNRGKRVVSQDMCSGVEPATDRVAATARAGGPCHA